ncbi:UDP-GlcNAc:betaGal beta-1 3-N-acetylglucosaminyltransferase protein 1, partial [Trichostrongylus colubriformis]
MDVSVVIPVKNGVPHIHECLESLLNQTFQGTWEICVYNDGSTDTTITHVEKFVHTFVARGVDLRIRSGLKSGGVGYAKNRAVEMGTGRFICFCDADDLSDASRIQTQYDMASSCADRSLVFVGSNFRRLPEGSTERYTRWANGLHADQIKIQIYTSHGPTLIAPTWFISRELHKRLNGFREDVRAGYPEDLDFFYRALDLGGVVFSKPNFIQVGKALVTYRYHDGCASLGVPESAIWKMRIDRFCDKVLPHWPTFTIWNAGKQGKRFFRSLPEEYKARVVSFCDVDEKKIKKGVFEEYDEVARVVRWKLPIVHV